MAVLCVAELQNDVLFTVYAIKICRLKIKKLLLQKRKT